MRILHVLPSLKQSYGGPIRAVLDLTYRAEKYGLSGEVLGCGLISVPDNPLRPELVHSVPLSAFSGYAYAPELRPWLRANLSRFDGVVIHGMWLYPGWAVYKECIASGIPYACFPHGMLERWAVFGQGWWKAAKKVTYWNLREQTIIAGARCVFFTTRRERELAQKTFALSGPHLILAPYGVDTTTVATPEPQSPTLRQPLDRKVAVFLGRIHPKKNVHLLIEAWHAAKLPSEWHLVIAGSGEQAYTNRLKRMVQESGISNSVHFVGFVAGADKSYLLQRSDWFLLPSFQENFGLSVLEAIANGCPVAISDQVFIAEVLHEHSEVLPLRLDSWVEFFRERMVDNAWRTELARRDRELLVPKLSIESVAELWTDTLTESFRNTARPIFQGAETV